MKSVFPLRTSRNPHLCALFQALHTSGVAVLFFYVVFFYVRSQADLRHFDVALSPSLRATLHSLRERATAELLLRPAWLFFPFAAIYAHTWFESHAESGFRTAREYGKLYGILVASLVLSFIVLTLVCNWAARTFPHPGFQVGAAALTLLALWHLQGIGTELLSRGGTATIRGSALLETSAAKARADSLRPPKQRLLQPFRKRSSTDFPFGGLFLPAEVVKARPHFGVAGAPGGGKTVCMKMLMRPALAPQGREDEGCRALVFDPNATMYPYLRGLGIERELIFVLNPFDERSVAWDMAADVTSVAAGEQLADILCPIEATGDNLWVDRGAQAVLREMLQGLHARSPGEWTLLTVVEAAQSHDEIRALLSLTADGKHRLDQLFRRERNSSYEILSNLDEKLSRFRTIARLWERSIRAGRKVGLSAWSQGDGILLLGHSESFTRPLQAMNQAIVRRVSELLCDKPSDQDDHSWVFLDEASALGEQKGLDQLLQRGRQKGVHVVFCFQSMVSGLRPEYPEGGADNMWAMCEHQIILRVNDVDNDGKWASEQFGKFEYWEKSRSVSPTGVTETEAKKQSELLLPKEFAEFPPASREGGLTGAFASSLVGAWTTRMSWKFVTRHMPDDSKDPEDARFIKRPDEDQLPIARPGPSDGDSGGLRDPLPDR